MPSPFPGMDPYLEGSEWDSFRAGFASEISRQLMPQLVPRYIARHQTRLVEADSVRSLARMTVEVRDTADRRLVTRIEILSPMDKRAEGREQYLRERQRLLLSTVHLLEIDLLREGERLLMPHPLPDEPYFVYVGRADRRPETFVWPVALDQTLPRVPVPLRPYDFDVSLDLQQALTSVYDLLRFDLTADYTRAPEVPLRPHQAAWVRERLGIPRAARQ